MGLQDIDGSPSNGDFETSSIAGRFRTYPPHERQDCIHRWFEELERRFPEPIQCSFIEVSPEMDSMMGMAYWRRREGENIYYIRLSHRVFQYEDWRARQTLLHEMVHIYFYQNGMTDVSDGSSIFKWVCGRVGAKINQIGLWSKEWEKMCRPFYESKERLTKANAKHEQYQQNNERQ